MTKQQWGLVAAAFVVGMLLAVWFSGRPRPAPAPAPAAVKTGETSYVLGTDLRGAHLFRDATNITAGFTELLRLNGYACGPDLSEAFAFTRAAPVDAAIAARLDEFSSPPITISEQGGVRLVRADGVNGKNIAMMRADTENGGGSLVVCALARVD